MNHLLQVAQDAQQLFLVGAVTIAIREGSADQLEKDLALAIALANVAIKQRRERDERGS